MPQATPRLALPYLMVAQSQKEVTHNEALAAIDRLISLNIVDRDLATPPLSPNEGDVYLVPATPTDAWIGQEGNLAVFSGGGWQFFSPIPGLLAWLVDEAIALRFDGTTWLERGAAGVAPQAAAIADPSGGTTIDDVARTSVAAILQVMREHGFIAT